MYILIWLNYFVALYIHHINMHPTWTKKKNQEKYLSYLIMYIWMCMYVLVQVTYNYKEKSFFIF